MLGSLTMLASGRIGQLAELGQRVVGQAELSQDAPRQRDVTGLDLDAGLVGIRGDDGEEGVRREQRRLVGLGVDDRGHRVASSCSEEFFSTSRYLPRPPKGNGAPSALDRANRLPAAAPHCADPATAANRPALALSRQYQAHDQQADAEGGERDHVGRPFPRGEQAGEPGREQQPGDRRGEQRAARRRHPPRPRPPSPGATRCTRRPTATTRTASSGITLTILASSWRPRGRVRLPVRRPADGARQRRPRRASWQGRGTARLRAAPPPGHRTDGGAASVADLRPAVASPRLLRVGCHDRLPRPAVCGRPAFWLLNRQFTGDVAGRRAQSRRSRQAGTHPAFTTLRLLSETFRGLGRMPEESNATVR